MLGKCCTQYASESGKLSSGHRTGKGQFSFEFQRKAMSKNVQTTTQLHSSHMLVSMGWQKAGHDWATNTQRTGRGQFSFQSQIKAMPKNAPTTTQLHSSHMLVKWCLKFSKSGFSNMWTVNFQMFKLVLEKAEEPKIKSPTSAGSWKKQEFQKNCFIDYWLLLFLLYWLWQSLWLCGSQ